MYDRKGSDSIKTQKRGSRSVNLLLEIGQAIEDVHFGLARPGLVVKFGIDGARDFLKREEWLLRRQELRRLEKRWLIVSEKIANKYWTTFSKQGFEEYLTQVSMRSGKLSGSQKCLVSFDIPETQKKLRNHIRNLLRKLGFVKIHKSVWSCNRDVCDQVRELFFSKFDGKQWFKVYLAQEL